MANKSHLIYRHDGQGSANNERACVEFAQSIGLRSDQYEVRKTGLDSNTVQERGLYVTDAAYQKYLRRRKETEMQTHAGTAYEHLSA